MTTKRLRRMPNFLSLIALLIILVGYCHPLQAQLGMATLSGSVTDSSGAAIPGAVVNLQSSTQKANHRLTADSTGKYFIPAIVPGTYDLTITADGFDTNDDRNGGRRG
jgi:hypothetical protein